MRAAVRLCQQDKPGNDTNRKESIVDIEQRRIGIRAVRAGHLILFHDGSEREIMQIIRQKEQDDNAGRDQEQPFIKTAVFAALNTDAGHQKQRRHQRHRHIVQVPCVSQHFKRHPVDHAVFDAAQKEHGDRAQCRRDHITAFSARQQPLLYRLHPEQEQKTVQRQI